MSYFHSLVSVWCLIIALFPYALK